MDPSEQPVGDIQEERQTTLEQVESIENIISSGDIKVDGSAQLQDLVVSTYWRLIITTFRRKTKIP